MFKQEFIERSNAAIADSKRFGIVWGTTFFLILIVNVPLSRMVPKEYSVIYLIGFFGFLFGNMFFLRWMERRRADRFQLRCPNCQQPLLRAAGQMAIATGNCNKCGEAVYAK
jgi:ribosomal protein L37AE/L43A